MTRIQPRTPLTILFVFFAAQACVNTNSPAALSTAISNTPSTPHATEIQTPHRTEPLVSAPRLRFDSWSPDSQWIGYWFAEGDNQAAHLAFINVQSGKNCQQDVVADNIDSGHVSWGKDNQVIVVQSSKGSALGGVPCGVFSPTEGARNFRAESSISPDGRYRADTIPGNWEGELVHNVTTITEVSTNRTTHTVKWDGSPHVWAESGWLNNRLYLVGLDVKRGALYISVPDGKVSNVVSDLLGLDVHDLGTISHVGRQANPANGEYHLLIEFWNGSPGPPLLLYHSETGLVEKLSFYKSWIVNGSSLSLDGKWLFLSYPSSKQYNEIEDFWIRPVDPAGSPAMKPADGMGFAGFSNEARKMVFIDKNYAVYVLNFPNGERIGSWYSPNYSIDRAWWAPDGKRVAMQGFPTRTQSEAIFIIEP